MQWQQSNFGYWLRFQKDDVIPEKLLHFVTNRSIQSAYITGIGAVSQVEIGYYDHIAKQYIKQTFTENLEVLALTGNLAYDDASQPIAHLHIVLSRRDFTSIGGHVFQAVVNPTLEVALITDNTKLVRLPEKDFGLKLLNLNNTGEGR